MSIKADAFFGCDELTTVIMPESLTTFEAHGLSNLKNIKFNTYKGAKYFGSESNPYKALVGVEEGLTECFPHSDTEIICAGAFKDAKSLKSIVLPNGLKHLMNKAFDGCSSLKKVMLEDGCATVDFTALGSLAESVYTYCNGLKYLGSISNPYEVLIGVADKAKAYEIHPDTKKINVGAFKNAKELVTLSLPEGVNVIGREAFAYCQNLNKIYLPSTLERICAKAFCGCSVLEETHVADIGAWCKVKFDCDIGDAKYTNPLSHSDLYIGEKKGEHVIIPSGVKEIEAYAFKNCKTIKRVELPQGLKNVNGFAFSGCTSLQEVKIPSSVEFIGAYAFNWCTSLKEVALPPVKEICWSTFNNCHSLARVTFSAGLKTIDRSAFEYCKALESIVLPDGVNEISEEVFKDCISLKQAVLPESVTKILRNAFADCKSLESVTLPRAVTKFGAHVFQGCRSLKSVVIPAVEIIEHESFRGCYSLESAIILPGTRVLGDEVFAGCTKLARVELSEGLETLCSNIFDMCQSLYKLTLPSSLKNIYSCAFTNSRIRDLKIPDGCSIRSEAFACSGINRIEIPDTVTEIGRDIFRFCGDDVQVIASDEVKERIKNA